MTTPPPRSVGSMFRDYVDVRRGEMAPLVVSMLYFYFTLSSYSILRPIRDEMAVAGGVRGLPLLFLGTLTANLIANPLFGALVSRFPMRKFVVATYAFFALNLVVLYFLWRSHWHEVGVGRAFYVWTTVYSLFVISVFWSVMVDSFHQSQAKRLFGVIAVAGTLGFITGSGITAFLVEKVGVANLLLVSAAFLVIAASLVARFPRVPVPAEEAGHPTAGADRRDEIVGGNAWGGIKHVFGSPYLGGICVFLLLYTLGSTVLYAAQTDILGQVMTDRAERTAFLARIDFTTQAITGVGQALLTARMIRGAGLGVTISAVPFVSIVGFAALGLAGAGILPLLATFVALSVTRRVAEYVLTQPSRKLLFTVLSREDKYKATNFIETFVYRFGDQIAVWLYALATAAAVGPWPSLISWIKSSNRGFGLSLMTVAWVAAVISIPFLLLGVWLSRRQRILSTHTAPSV